MANKIRRPTQHSGKNIAAPEQLESSNTKHPVFCFQYMDSDFGTEKCEKNEKVDVLRKLCQLSQQSWLDLLQKLKIQGGFTTIPREQLRRPTPAHVTEDTPIIKVRFKDAKTLVGYRDGVVFHIVWIDRDYSLYNHGK
jgi:hypothetical protein